MKPEEAFAVLLQRCREDVKLCRAVERLFDEYKSILPPIEFEWRELSRKTINIRCGPKPPEGEKITTTEEVMNYLKSKGLSKTK